MIKHIVFWNLKSTALGADKCTNRQRLKDRLEALPSVITEIRELEVGFNINTADTAWDVALYSTFDRMEDLQTYQDHPAHQDVVAFVREIVSARAVVDYAL